MNNLTAVLLVNLGTPSSPDPQDVYRYLIEFLTDGRVIDLPWLKRQLLVRGIIVPKRYKESAKAYQHIWTENGSPLLIHGNNVKQALQQKLGPHYLVELAMRYQEPSIKNTVELILNQNIEHLIILPLFPQYASATTGSIFQRIQEILSSCQVIPRLSFIDQFATHPKFISAFSAIAKPLSPKQYDHILFSFHGLPEKHIRKADMKKHCFSRSDCCSNFSENNFRCYAAQCHATARAIASELDLQAEKYSICFQSRLGKDPWLKPYTREMILDLAKKGKKRVLVFCPAFVCDCLETLYEIGVEYSEEFKAVGGTQLDLVPGLNSHPLWVEALHDLIKDFV